MRLTLSLPKLLLSLERAKGGTGKAHDEPKVRMMLEQWGGDDSGQKEVDGMVDIARVFQRFAAPADTDDDNWDGDNSDDELDDALKEEENAFYVPATAWDIGALLRALSAPHDSFAVEVALDQMVITPESRHPDAGVVTFQNFVRWWHQHKDEFYFVVKSDRGLSGPELVAQRQASAPARTVGTTNTASSLHTPRTPRGRGTGTPRSRRGSTQQSFTGVSSTLLRSSASLGRRSRSLSRSRARPGTATGSTMFISTAAAASASAGHGVELPSSGPINRVVYQGAEKTPVGNIWRCLGLVHIYTS